MFIVTLNNKKIFEYSGNTRLPGHERRYLDGMDEDMDQGIKIDGVIVVSPDSEQRLDYIVFKLLQGHDENNQGLIQSMSAYITSRFPDLTAIHIVQKDADNMLSITYE